MNFNEDPFIRSLTEDPELFDGEKELEMLEEKIREKLVERFGDNIYSDQRLNFLSQSVGQMILKAREAAENAIQYRNFKVSCSVLTVRDRVPKIFKGNNLKLNQEGAKICAEQAALISAIKNGKTSDIVGIFVAGEAQIDSNSGLYSPTLHPCANCRELISTMLKAGGNELKDVILVTIGLKSDEFELMTWEELLQKHEKK